MDYLWTQIPHTDDCSQCRIFVINSVASIMIDGGRETIRNIKLVLTAIQAKTEAILDLNSEEE